MAISRPDNAIDIHESIIKLMRALGYPTNEGGMCFGIASMSMQAMIADDLLGQSTFYVRLMKMVNFINNYHSLAEGIAIQAIERNFGIENINIASLSTEQQKVFNQFYDEVLKNKLEELIGDKSEDAIDLRAFCDGVALHFAPGRFDYIFGEEIHHQQGMKEVLPITTPKNIEDIGIHQYDTVLAGCSNHSELVSLLEQIELHIAAVSDQPISFMVGNSAHAIMIGYDPRQEEPWVFADPNNLPPQTILDKAWMAAYIMMAFGQHDADNVVALNMQMFTLNNNMVPSYAQQLEGIKNQWLKNMTSDQINRIDNTNTILLHIAVKQGDVEYVDVCLAAGLNPNQKNNKGLNAADYIDISNISLFKKILPYLEDTARCKSLYKAALFNNEETIKYLISNNINPNQSEKGSESPLEWAVTRRKVDITKLLVASPIGIAPTITSKGGTILHLAVDNPEILKILLQHTQDKNTLNVLDHNSQTVLHLAIEQKNLEAIKEIVIHQPNVNILNSDNKSSFYMIAFNLKDAALIKKCLELGGDPTIKDNNGNTLLHLATAKGDKELLSLLLNKYHLDPNTINKLGETPLNCITKSLELVNILLEAGANPLSVDAQNETFIDKAPYEDKEACQLLTLKYYIYQTWGLKAGEIDHSKVKLPAEVAAHLDIIQQAERKEISWVDAYDTISDSRYDIQLDKSPSLQAYVNILENMPDIFKELPATSIHQNQVPANRAASSSTLHAFASLGTSIESFKNKKEGEAQHKNVQLEAKENNTVDKKENVVAHNPDNETDPTNTQPRLR